MNRPSMSVQEAFETLHLALEAALKATEAEISHATQVRDFDGAQEALNRARELEQFRIQLDEFQAKVADYIIEYDGSGVPPKIGPGLKRSRELRITPLEDYYRPILEALVELGGRANLHDVLDKVSEKMRDQFTELDCALLPSGRDYRWRNRAQWARFDMCQEGLLRNDSPRGIWEISEKGYAWLEKYYS